MPACRALRRPLPVLVLLPLLLLGLTGVADAAPLPATAGTAALIGTTGAPAAADGAEHKEKDKDKDKKKKKKKKKRTRAEKVRHMLRVARKQTGDPYRYGAAGPDAFDCSGLVYFSTHRAGFPGVPRTSSAQSGFMKRIKRKAMRPGDFVFFTGSGGVYHVGVYAGRRDGNRRVLHAPSTGSTVRTDPIWTDSWFAGTLRK